MEPGNLLITNLQTIADKIQNSTSADLAKELQTCLDKVTNEVGVGRLISDPQQMQQISEILNKIRATIWDKFKTQEGSQHAASVQKVSQAIFPNAVYLPEEAWGEIFSYAENSQFEKSSALMTIDKASSQAASAEKRKRYERGELNLRDDYGCRTGKQAAQCIKALHFFRADFSPYYQDFTVDDLKELISDWSGIKELKFSNFGELPPEIGNLTNLEKLDLGFTLFPLPKEIGNLKNLRLLSLTTGTPEPKLIEELKTLANLKTIILLNLHGEEPILYQMRQLETLELHCLEVSSEIQNLKNLKHLTLHGTDINRLPDEIGALTNLVDLNLNLPFLENLPDSIGNLSNLVDLNLNLPSLKSLPDSIGNLSNLESLNLDHTKIWWVPESFGNLTQLKRLSLLFNPFQYFANLNHLEQVKLYGKEVSVEELKDKSLQKVSYEECAKNLAEIIPNLIRDIWDWKIEKTKEKPLKIKLEKERLVALIAKPMTDLELVGQAYWLTGSIRPSDLPEDLKLQMIELSEWAHKLDDYL